MYRVFAGSCCSTLNRIAADWLAHYVVEER